jgi:SHS2 domain-containing protein
MPTDRDRQSDDDIDGDGRQDDGGDGDGAGHRGRAGPGAGPDRSDRETPPPDAADDRATAGEPTADSAPAAYALRGHTADIAVEAWGGTLSDAFAAAADGLAAACCEDVPPEGTRFGVAVSAADREALLFDYLDRLIYERDVRAVLPVANEATVTPPGSDAEGRQGDATGHGEWTLDATARGVPLASIRDRAREIKAVTYSEMCVEEDPETGRVRVYVVLDV